MCLCLCEYILEEKRGAMRKATTRLYIVSQGENSTHLSLMGSVTQKKENQRGSCALGWKIHQYLTKGNPNTYSLKRTHWFPA